MEEEEGAASWSALRIMLIVIITWSTLYGIYTVVSFLLQSFGGSFLTLEEGEACFPDGGHEVRVDVNEVFYPVSYWTEKGSRPYQEDRLDIRHGSCPRILKEVQKNQPNDERRSGNLQNCVLPDTSLYAVYDGHGGAKASHYCTQHLLTRLIEFAFSCVAEDKVGQRENSPEQRITASSDAADSKRGSGQKSKILQEKIFEAIRKAFCSVDKSFEVLSKKHSFVDGSTAVVAVIHDEQLIVGNAGDSRCILVQRGGRVKVMSDDHKPSRVDEERRIKGLGGRVMFWGIWRVEGVLAVSRAIGDVPLKPFITAEPEITSHDLRTDDDAMFVVLASDGLFDVMSNEEVARFITRECQRSHFKDFARNLCDEAVLLGSQDNVTVQVIDVRTRRGRLTTRKGKSPKTNFSHSPCIR